MYFLTIYMAFGIGQAVTAVIKSLSVQLSSLVAARKIHKRLLDSILKAPTAFFDVTPVVRPRPQVPTTLLGRSS